MVIVGALSPDDNSSHIDELRGLQPQLDVDVLVNPPRADLRRLSCFAPRFIYRHGVATRILQRTRPPLRTRSRMWGQPFPPAALPSSSISARKRAFARCTPPAARSATKTISRSSITRPSLRTSGGLSAGQSEKMEAFSPAAHGAAWARIISRLDPNESKPDRPPALVVTGCHRSGTSAMARVLSLAGADLPRDMMASAFDNPTAFPEPAAIAEFNDTLLMSRGSSWHDMFTFSKGHSGGGADRGRHPEGLPIA